jgi:hypothetical protein
LQIRLQRNAKLLQPKIILQQQPVKAFYCSKFPATKPLAFTTKCHQLKAEPDLSFGQKTNPMVTGTFFGKAAFPS